jgi:DTW domain-containing protein YfiP
MLRTSAVLSKLPKISFQVNKPSRFQFKKQPKDFCLSTVEAVHLLIENLQVRGLCTVNPPGAQTRMLDAFDLLVRTQLKFVPESGS